MKRYIVLLAAFMPLASAQNGPSPGAPTILGTIPNRDNNNITFTTVQSDCPENQYLVYAQSDGGRISLTGCYRLVSNQFFVKWVDGDVYTYPADNLIPSDEFLNYMNRNRK